MEHDEQADNERFTFFIDGRRHDGAPTVEALTAALNGARR